MRIGVEALCWENKHCFYQHPTSKTQGRSESQSKCCVNITSLLRKRLLTGVILFNSLRIRQFTPRPSQWCCRCILSVTQTNPHVWMLVLAFMQTYKANPEAQSSMVFDMDFCATILQMCVLSRAQNFFYGHFRVLFH